MPNKLRKDVSKKRFKRDMIQFTSICLYTKVISDNNLISSSANKVIIIAHLL